MPGQDRILELVSRLRPRPCVHGDVRVGGSADGGYVVPRHVESASAVVSLGIGDDVSFDRWFADRSVPVYQYDHTVASPPEEHAGFHLERVAWGGKDAEGVRSLHGIIDQRDLPPFGSAVLKFDVEGAEWGCLASASTEELSTFAVITGEFHGLNLLGEDAFFNRAASVLELILRTHVPTHVHANNAAPLTLVRGIPMPWLLEVSFLRRDLCSFAPAHGGIPGLLDRPNALADDIVLSAWSHASTAADDSLGFQALQSEALDRSMAALTDAVLERDAAIQEREAVMQEAADLREALAASRAEGEQLHEALVEAYELHEKAIASRDEAVREYMSLRASRSWRYTSWMRRD